MSADPKCPDCAGSMNDHSRSCPLMAAMDALTERDIAILAGIPVDCGFGRPTESVERTLGQVFLGSAPEGVHVFRHPKGIQRDYSDGSVLISEGNSYAGMTELIAGYNEYKSGGEA